MSTNTEFFLFFKNMSTTIIELEKTILSLEKALDEQPTDIVRDATIQRFEFCIELSWKVSKKLMGTVSTSPKQVIREMAQNSYIDDPEMWLQAIDQRNLSVHTYNEALALEIYTFIRVFFPEFRKLLSVIKR